MKKNIRSKSVKESLLDYNNLATTLKENTQNAVKDLLAETVRNTYASILSEEEEDDEYKEEEVEDTDADLTDDDTNDTEESDGTESFEDDDDNETDSEDTGMESDIEDEEGDEKLLTDDSDEEDDSDVWGEFDKYKVGEGQYDFSEAEDEEVVKVYKLLKNDDQVMVTQKGEGQVEIKDNETGTEYIIDMNPENSATEETEIEVELDDDDDPEENDLNEMNESTERLYELVLEYDSHVGYTDNYQKKDVMTTPSMDEPGKGNDWDKGVPHGKEKPWSGYPSKKKKADAPFNAGKGKQIDEEMDIEEAKELDEATNVGGFVQQNSTSKSHVPNSSGRSARSASKGGKRIKGTTTPRYSNSGDGELSESAMRKVNTILRENKELKKALGQWKNTLQEAAVTNLNLGQIIKLISENTTSKAEKQEIIARFGKEAKTVEQSKNLYEAISKDLKKNRQMNINEEKEITATGSRMINETQIYQSADLLNSLDLMHRLCK